MPINEKAGAIISSRFPRAFMMSRTVKRRKSAARTSSLGSRIRHEERSDMAPNELQMFLDTFEREAAGTLKVLRSLPTNQYDFRPDPEGRSLGELAWHLAEGDAYMTWGIAQGNFNMAGPKPPNIERPRTVEALAPGFERVHQEAVERVKKLK